MSPVVVTGSSLTLDEVLAVARECRRVRRALAVTQRERMLRVMATRETHPTRD